jgi:hypothetical protein
VATRRDPLSVQYDDITWRLLLRAVRNHQRNPKEPTGAEIFVVSPPREFRDLDYGRRTAHERAFTRSLYYIVFRVPRLYDSSPKWSAKLVWGPIEKRSSRWGRVARVRLFRAGSGTRFVERIMARDPWSEDTLGVGSWRDGTRRSMPGDRIDSGRRQVNARSMPDERIRWATGRRRA